MANRYVVEVERDGVRALYGTFDDLKEAQKEAQWFIDHHEGMQQVLIRELNRVPIAPHIHPGQTTIQDHINNVADYVDPNSVS